jgi:small subunit ribosomal protein S18
MGKGAQAASPSDRPERIPRRSPHPAQAAAAKPEKAPKPKRLSCFFCASHSTPDYKDPDRLRPFLSRRYALKRAVGKGGTALCRRHQKELAVAVKRARLMALLPYTEIREVEWPPKKKGKRKRSGAQGESKARQPS